MSVVLSSFTHPSPKLDLLSSALSSVAMVIGAGTSSQIRGLRRGPAQWFVHSIEPMQLAGLNIGWCRYGHPVERITLSARFYTKVQEPISQSQLQCLVFTTACPRSPTCSARVTGRKEVRANDRIAR